MSRPPAQRDDRSGFRPSLPVGSNAQYCDELVL